MNLLLRFSGIGAILVTMFLIITPALYEKVKGTYHTISEATLMKKSLRYVSFGLVLGALLQGVFLVYLAKRFDFSLISLPSILYLSTNLATILVAVYPMHRNKRIHYELVRYYFYISPIVILLMGYKLSSVFPEMLLISFLIFIAYVSSEALLFRKYKKENIIMQSTAFILLAVWTTIATLI